jgi:hypothetical protein
MAIIDKLSRKRYPDTRSLLLTDDERVVGYVDFGKETIPMDTAIIDTYWLELPGPQADVSTFTRKPALTFALLGHTFLFWSSGRFDFLPCAAVTAAFGIALSTSPEAGTFVGPASRPLLGQAW